MTEKENVDQFSMRWFQILTNQKSNFSTIFQAGKKNAVTSLSKPVIPKHCPGSWVFISPISPVFNTVESVRLPCNLKMTLCNSSLWNVHVSAQSVSRQNRNKSIVIYDERLFAGREIKYRAPHSRSRFSSGVDQHLRVTPKRWICFFCYFLHHFIHFKTK